MKLQKVENTMVSMTRRTRERSEYGRVEGIIVFFTLGYCHQSKTAKRRTVFKSYK